MGKTYLFTPIGNTDPIKYFYDGSMLHICRYYKPDIVYVYLSREMIVNHKKDNRYVKTLKLLGQALSHEFQIEIIEDNEMVNVQQYDVFYHKFHNIIGKIEEKMGKDDTLLVNMASGTPAMKSALVVMATLAEYRFRPIQVSTPKKESNKEYEEREDYDVETNWELNADNQKDAENRCQEVQCMNLVYLLKIDIIKKHLLSYNYKAALEVGKGIKNNLSTESLKWLEAADARASLDWKRMNRNIPKNVGVLKPVQEENRNKILFEYALLLDLKVKRGEYADFLRAITPLGVDLLELVIIQYCDIDINQYYDRSDKLAKKWSNTKLNRTEVLTILERNFAPFHFGPVYSSHLNCIVKEKCNDTLVKDRVQELADVEKRVRNIAAHSIVSVTPEWVKEKTGKTVNEILWIVKFLCKGVKINQREENWESYDLMNQSIIGELEKI